jgi:hypothetical protein
MLNNFKMRAYIIFVYLFVTGVFPIIQMNSNKLLCSVAVQTHVGTVIDKMEINVLLLGYICSFHKCDN